MESRLTLFAIFRENFRKTKESLFGYFSWKYGAQKNKNIGYFVRRSTYRLLNVVFN